MPRPFYIVPSTRNYYETVNANSKEDALIDFATNMTDDMAAYFKATDKIPVTYPYAYEHPEGNFQMAMRIIMDSIDQKTSSKYYNPGIITNINHDIRVDRDVIGKLQAAYDAIYAYEERNGMKAKINRRFLEILIDMTDFDIENADMP